MTRAEAREKWCPFARVATGATDGEVIINAIATNRRSVGDPSAGTLCIAERCMAWRQSYDDDPTSGRCGLAHGI